GVAKGARRPRSRFVGALEPLTRAGVAYYERELRDLVRINYVEPVRSAMALTGHGGDEDLALGHVGYFAELIDEWAPEAHADERLFRLGASMVDALASGAPIDPLARYFEYWLLRLQGVYPSLACVACGGSLQRRAVMPRREHTCVGRRCAPAGGTGVSSAGVQFLSSAGSVAPARLESLSLTPQVSRELETAHRRLINLHLEKELKSTRVLREMRLAR